ncbi:Prophage CP4-57 integrase [compost metagenome]
MWFIVPSSFQAISGSFVLGAPLAPPFMYYEGVRSDLGEMMPQDPVRTDRQIAALRSREARYEVAVADSRGLYIRVWPTGAKGFELRYTAENGKRRRHVLGAYPDVTLAEARRLSAAARVAVLGGTDPVAERSARREEARTGETLEELAEAYWRAASKGLHGGRRRPKQARTIESERSLFRRYIKPALGDMRFAAIRRTDIRIFMRDLAANSGLAPASLASVGGVLLGVLGFAVYEDRLEANPAYGLTRPLALMPRERMFDDEALRILWNEASLASLPRTPGEKTAGKHARLDAPTGLAIQFLMTTLTRRSEAAEVLWSEIDMDSAVWTIPSHRSKARHVQVVPLPDEALAILRRARALYPKSPWVFPAPRNRTGPVDSRALTRAVVRTCTRRNLPAGSPHDVRRSGATTLTGRYGVGRFIVGHLLGHTVRDGATVTGVYDRYSYMAEKRAALQTWASHVANLKPSGQASGACQPSWE